MDEHRIEHVGSKEGSRAQRRPRSGEGGVNSPQEVNEQRRMGLAMQGLAWVVLLAFGVYYFSGLLARQVNPNSEVSTEYGDNGTREVTLKRNRYGHYVASGLINGQPVTFLLDTGATGVAIPADVARRLGLRRGRAYRTQTANGVSTGYATVLDRVSVGAIELSDVQAGIAPGLNTEQVLLGMSFLKHIEFTQRGNTLKLRQYP